MSAKMKRLLRLYEDELPSRYSERTAPQYLSQVLVFLGWLSHRDLELTDVRTEDIEAYLNDELGQKRPDGKPYSLSTHQKRLLAVKSLFQCLYRRGYLLHDPSSSIGFKIKMKRLPRVILTEKEARKIIDAARDTTPEGLRDRAILETFYGTGIRVTELANLTLEDADTEEKTLRIVLGKGQKDRNVPLTTAAAEAIAAYVESGRSKLVRSTRVRYLFVGNQGGWLHRAVLSRIVQRYAEKAGIKKHVTCHTFRHSVATHLLRNRADIRHIQMLLGHESLQTTQLYTRVEISDLKKVIERAHPRR
jgi:integrase/recombinase XerD